MKPEDMTLSEIGERFESLAELLAKDCKPRSFVTDEQIERMNRELNARVDRQLENESFARGLAHTYAGQSKNSNPTGGA